jgi:hypothetical protein
MFGLSPYTVETRPNESGDGYVARVEVRTLDERTIAAAEAEGARDEPNWKNRPKHALRGMAETRATSRALRGPLEQVFALAGYEGTAAEEMISDSAPVPHTPPPTTGKLPDAVKPTQEQVDELNRLIGELGELQPQTDWAKEAHRIVGVPGDQVTRGTMDVLLGKLRAAAEELRGEGVAA